MTSRLLIAACSALVFAGASIAQPPGPVPEINHPPMVVNGGPPPALADGPAVPLPSCGCDDDACRAAGPRFWLTADYLLGWIQAGNLPPMVTTSPAGTPQGAAGILGSPTTSTLFGGSVHDEVRSGFRADTSYWFNRDRTLAVEAGVMMLESQSSIFQATSSGTPILARPYIDATTGAPQAVLIAFPGSSSGAVGVRASSGNFYETHVGMTERLLDTGNFRLFPSLGYRFYRYDEGLRVRQSIFPANPSFVPGTTIVTADDFATTNEFHGGDFGLQTEFAWRTLSVDLLTKVAAGNLHRTVNIIGTQTTTVPGAAPVSAVGGVYALSSNIGNHQSNDWVVLPEFGLNLGWQVRPHMQVRLGYTLLLLADIARAAGQLDQTVNPGLLPPATAAGTTGPARPTFDLVKQDIWLQAISIGMQYSF